jgi:RNA polymerase sigma-70 factor (ECF subfamily)
MGLYVWLRRLTWDQLLEIHRRLCQRRHVTELEGRRFSPATDTTAVALAVRLLAGGVGSGTALCHDEMLARVRLALGQLPDEDRDLLVMRHLDQLSTLEIAAKLGIEEEEVMLRHLRALERLQSVLCDSIGGDTIVETRPRHMEDH